MERRWFMEPVILLIDDSENDSMLLDYAFKKAGLAHPLRVVRDGVDAISYLLGRGAFSDRVEYPLPDILLIDLNMPRLNGLELLAWLKTQPDLQHLTVVVLTGSARKEEINIAYQMGAKSYLVKPSQSQTMQRLIDSFFQYWVVHNHPPDPAPSADLPPESARTLGRNSLESRQMI